MVLKESFVGLYVRRFVIPGALIFNKPGFVDFKISGKTNIYARQIFYPEDFFIRFEGKIVKKFGKDGKDILYSIGKRFGYRFAKAGKFENIHDHPGDKIKEWLFIASKFVEGTYASLVDSNVDVDLKKVDYVLKRWTILETLGYDYIFAVGGAAGLVAWILQEPKIEGTLDKVKLVDSFYEGKVVCAPSDYLKKEFSSNDLFEETNFDDLDQDASNYIKFNKETIISHKKSFKTYLDFKIFDYDKGIVSFNGNRFFLFEASGTYLLEYDLARKNKKEFLDILFESAFESGEQIMSKFGTTVGEIFEVLSALGWGEVMVFEASSKGVEKVIINHFPWSKWYSDVDFIIMRGFLSGIFSSIKGKKVLFLKPKVDLSKGQLSLLLEGEYV